MPGKYFGDATSNRKNEKLIASYTVQGVSWDSSQISIDTATGTITISNHGLVNGDKVGFGVSGGDNVPIFSSAQTSGTQLYVVNATTNTFQLSTSSGGSALGITTANTSGSWKLYKYALDTIPSFSNINYKKIRVKIRGNAFVASGASKVQMVRNNDSNTAVVMPVASSNKPDLFDADIIAEVNDVGGLSTYSYRGQVFVRGMLSSGGVNYSIQDWGYSYRYNSAQNTIGSINFQFYGAGSFCAGTTVEVYGIE